MLRAAALADQHGFRSISFPAISSGIFAVPAAVCASAYLTAPRTYFDANPASGLQLVRLCLFDGPIAALVAGRVIR